MQVFYDRATDLDLLNSEVSHIKPFCIFIQNFFYKDFDSSKRLVINFKLGVTFPNLASIIALVVSKPLLNY